MSTERILWLILLLCIDWWYKKLPLPDVDGDGQSVDIGIDSDEASGNFINDIQGILDVEKRAEDDGRLGCSTGIYDYLVFACWMCLVAVITAIYCRSYYRKKLLDRSIHQLLQDYEVSDIFKSSPELERYSRSRPVQGKNFVNQLVDLILSFYKKHVIESGKRYIPGPDLKPTSGLYVDSISANNGTIGDLSTVYRTSSFSLDGNLDSEFTVFGSLGLSKLKVTYNNYKVDFYPLLYLSGSLTASVNSNSIYFEVTATLPNLKSLEIKKYDIRIRAPEICIQLFDENRGQMPVLSRVANLVIDILKSKIVDAVEESFRSIINEQLDKIGWQIPLGR